MGNKKTQKTPKGEEIPIPKRGEFIDNLRKVAEKKPKDSPPDNAEK